MQTSMTMQNALTKIQQTLHVHQWK